MAFEEGAGTGTAGRRAHLPRLVALVDLDAAVGEGGTGIAAALLDDLEEAALAYARLSIRELGEKDAPPCPAFARPEGRRTGRETAGAPVAQAVPDGRTGRPDALVVAFSADGAGDLAEKLAAMALERLAPLPGSRVYGVCVTTGGDPSPARRALGRLERRCSDQGLLWSGGLGIAGSEALGPAMRTARMGLRRRYASEALDELICALRSGTDAGILEARPGIAARALGILDRHRG